MKLCDQQRTKLLLIISSLFLLTACGLLGTSDVDTLSTVVAKTMTAVAQLPTLTPSVPQNAATVEISTSTPMSADKLYVKTIADNVNLRVNPGRLFQVSRILFRVTKIALQ